MAGPKTKQQEIQEERAGHSISPERASADYEQPRRDVADMPEPVVMPTNKARAGVQVPGMRAVLIGGIILTLVGYAVGYLLFYS